MDLNDGNGGNPGSEAGAGDAGTVDDILGGGGGEGQGVDAGGDGGEGESGGGGDGGQGGADPDFYSSLSTETGEGESASNLDVVKSKGWKTLDEIVKGYRSAERALRDGGPRVKVPGEGASEAEIGEYRKAIGVPDDAKGYAVPEIKDAAGNPIPLNTEMTDRITAAAHKHGVPKAALDALLADEIRAQVEANDAAIAELTEKANAHVKGWGADREAKMASVNAAAKAFGLSKPDLAAMRAALGPAKMLDMLAKAGENYNEDTLIQGDRKSFGMKPEEAQKELDAMKADKAIADKARVPGTPENQRWNRNLEIIAAAADRAPVS